MASFAVRQKVREWLGDVANPVKFFDTINFDRRPVDDVWCTVSFGAGDQNPINYCRDTIEDGAFTVIVYGRPGVGDITVIPAIESIAAFLMAQTDVNLKLLSHSSPFEFTLGDGVPRYGAEMLFNYERY
jgi:hypothetical protein